MPLSSIYRTLAVLAEHGVASPHHSRDGVTRYELAEPLQDHHHHVVCLACGRIEDVELDRQAETRLRELAAQVAGAASYSVSDHSLEIEGLCAECA